MKFLALVIAVMLLLPLSAYAQQPGPSRLDIIGANYSGPAFLDAFWTNTTTPVTGTLPAKVEVSPGDGTSVLAVTLVNRGFSEITAVRGLLTVPGEFGAAGSGSNTILATHNGLVSAGEVFTLFFPVNISERARVSEYTALLRVEYSRILEVGSPRTADMNVPFKVTGKVLLDASSKGGVAPGASGKVAIEITNAGSAPATGLVVTLYGSSGVNPTTQQTSIVVLGQKIFELGAIPAGGSALIEPTLYVSNASGNTLQTLELQMSYGNAYGERNTASVPVGLVVLPEFASSLVSVAPVTGSSIITAGKIADLNVSLANNRDQELTNVVVSVSSQSESIEILGDTSWTIGNMAPGSSQELSTKVFSSRDMIGRATSLIFTVQHTSAGQPEIETVELGAYVDGEININAYDIGVTYIGGRPNITGNLLNQGNVLALFTTIELVSAENLVDVIPPQQYLGDLTENSPLPFSIPIDVSEGVDSGTYLVELRIQYMNSLRESHAVDLSAPVNFAPEASSTNNSQAAADSSQAGIVIGIIAAAVAAFVIIRARKKTKLKHRLQFSKQNGGEDIESVLDSQMGKPEEKK